MDRDKFNFALDRVTEEKRLLKDQIDIYDYSYKQGYIERDYDLELEFLLRSDALAEYVIYLTDQSKLLL